MIASLIAGVCLAFGADGPAARTESGGRDTLVYKDGDRVQGHFVGEVGGTIMFKSDRFGELRVPKADVVVVKAERAASPAGTVAATATAVDKPTAAAKTHKTEKETAAERADEERVTIWERFSPSALTATVRNFFGPWHGRVAFSTEVVSDVADRNNTALEGHLQRKWKADEVQLNARFDYAETNKVATTDTVKGSGSWRHDFERKQFGQYRSTLEWNRASTLKGVPNDYVLLQQEIGAGFTLLAKPSRKVRAGVSENLFDVWNSAPGADHSSRAVESLFEETEFTLPWRMTMSQRGVWYPVRNQSDGWENRIELNKKLTETLSTSERHEIRRENPDGSSQDYSRLKLLLGFDF